MGGSMNLYVSDLDVNNSDIEAFTVSLAPTLTRFKSERKASGFNVSAGYSTSTTGTSGNISEYSRWEFGAGLFWQRYLLLGKGFYLFGEYGFNASYVTGWQNYNTFPVNTSDFKRYGAAAYLTPGFGYKLSNRLLLGLQFSHIGLIHFTHERSEDENGGVRTTNRRNNFGLSSSVNTNSLGNLGINFAWKLK